VLFVRHYASFKKDSTEYQRPKGRLTMERKEEPGLKQVKILKCVKCGKEYIYDSVSRRCPECQGSLKEETVLR